MICEHLARFMKIKTICEMVKEMSKDFRFYWLFLTIDDAKFKSFSPLSFTALHIRFYQFRNCFIKSFHFFSDKITSVHHTKTMH